MDTNLDDGNKQSNDRHPEDFEVFNDSLDSFNVIESNHDLITDIKTTDSNIISPIPITSQTSYTEALGGQGEGVPLVVTKRSNDKLFEFIIYTIIILISIGLVSFVMIRKPTNSVDRPASANITEPLIETTTNTTTPSNDTKPTDITKSANSCDAVEYQHQSTECKGYTISSGTINKQWKKYTINKYGVSFEYPSTLIDYKTNRAEDFVLFDAYIDYPDDKDSKVITLSSSACFTLQTKSTFPSDYETITMNTQMGEVQVKYAYGPYMNTGGIKYEYEYYYGGKYYYYCLFNISDDKKLMTTEEFKILIESTSVK